MEIIGPLLISTIAGLSTVIGSLIIFFHIKEEKKNKFITFCLSFSLAIMIMISITDLIPTSFFHLLEKNGLKGIIISICAFLLGIYLIKQITKKINKEKTTTNSLYKLGVLNMLALMAHNFPEGIITFLSSYQNIDLGIKLSIAIMLHNIPEGISIAVPIYYATKSKRKAIIKTFISGLAEPLGAILAFIFFKGVITTTIIDFTLMLVGGIMITLSIEEILPETLIYKEKKWQLIGLLTGICLILTSHFILG